MYTHYEKVQINTPFCALVYTLPLSWKVHPLRCRPSFGPRSQAIPTFARPSFKDNIWEQKKELSFFVIYKWTKVSIVMHSKLTMLLLATTKLNIALSSVVVI